METFKEKLIEIIGFGMEREHAECKADEILSLFSYPQIKELIKAQQELIDYLLKYAGKSIRIDMYNQTIAELRKGVGV